MNPLTVFPRHPSAPDTYYINGAWAPAAITAVEKRFSDAELMAEYWMWQGNQEWWLARPNMDRRSKVIQRVIHRAEVMARFARLPHHDEDPA